MAPAQIGRLVYDERIEVHELTPAHGGLEQVFFALTGGGEEAK
jgi:hypothetical protein